MSFYSFEDSYSSAFDHSEAANSVRSYTSVEESEESYTKVKVLGRGAFGEAVLYKKTATNDLVVWKEVNLQRASEKDRTGALNEVEILSLLDHINVVAYYNHFFDGASLFIEMEYANDGSLHHKIIARDGSLFPESEALLYFYQLVSAVSYIHNFGILHRDIKTLNIFMTQSKLIKLGDFGISKVLEETYGKAETCVGTPYYMSPEIVKGDPYNQKSDVWACGCVLFEILALKKVFEASNQLKLITSILEKDVGEVSSTYSEETKRVIKWTLEKDPERRPTTEELVALELFDGSKTTINNTPRAPPLLRRISSQRSMVAPMTPTASKSVSTLASDVFTWGGGKMVPQKLEPFFEGRSGMQVSSGFSHFAVVTIEKEVYTWANIQGGTEIVGQLGHGNTAMYRTPRKVAFFNGVPIKQVACGEDYTVFLSDSGDVYTCGSDYSGCIGCDGELGDNVLTPYKVEALSDKRIKRIASGDSHVVVLTDQGEVYAWGCGEFGRLGFGHEDDIGVPEQVPLPKTFASSIVDIACGRDNTFLLTTQGHLLAFGSNEDNKMALNQTVHLKKTGKQAAGDVVHYVTQPTPVRALYSYRLVAVSSGKAHSAALDEYGRFLTFGSNKYGQLGVGDYKPRISPSLVRGDLNGKEVMLCACGDGFTVVATKDNHLFSWGSAKNGRLGIQLAAGKTTCPSPKPIFGSLHKVASLSCRHWNTIILAEKLMDSKLIHTKELSLKEGHMSAGDRAGRNYKAIVGIDADETESSFRFDSIPFDDRGGGGGKGKLQRQGSTEDDPNNNNSDDDEDSMPPWLVDELENAEVIPMEKVADQQVDSNDTGGGGNKDEDEDDIPPWLAKEMESAEFIPMSPTHDVNSKIDEMDPRSNKEAGRTVSVRETFQSIRASASDAAVEKCAACLNREPNVLEVRIKELELERAQMLKRLKEQEVLIKKLDAEKECYQQFSCKLTQVVSQTLPSPLSSPRGVTGGDDEDDGEI